MSELDPRISLSETEDEPPRGDGLSGKTIAEIDWPRQHGYAESDVAVKFTDGTIWLISTCSCCGLSDSIEKEQAAGG